MVGNSKNEMKMQSFRCFEVLELDFMTLESGSNLDGINRTAPPDGIVHARVWTNLPAVEVGLKMWITLCIAKQITIRRLVRLD
jgi:hypothetical protein